MARILNLAAKDIRVLFADKSNLFWVFGFPVLFALFFGAIFAGSGEGPSGLKIAIVDEDQSDFSELYVSHLESDDALKITFMDRDQALGQVRTGKQVAAVILKEGFGDTIGTMFGGGPAKMEIAADPGRRMEGGYLQGLLAKAQFQALGDRFVDPNWTRKQMDTWRSEVAAAGDLGDTQAAVFTKFFDAFDTFLDDVDPNEYRSGFGDGTLNFATVDVQREYEGPRTPFQITFPQAIIWGILGCSATFAISIVQERTKGTYQRLRIGPLSRAHILGGKGLACFVTCGLVVALLYAGGRLIFRVPIASGALLVVAGVCVSLCFVGLMMFVCTLGKTEQGAGGAGWAILMIMAMLGGGMVPLFFMPTWMRSLSHISPVKWSVYALEGAIWRNFSFAEMLAPCAILLAIGAGFFLLGSLMLRRVE